MSKLTNYLKLKVDFILVNKIFFLLSIFIFLGNIPFNLGLLTIIILLYSSFLIILKNEYFFYLIPAFILLSPIFGSYNLFGFNLLLTDYILFFSFINLIIRYGTKFSLPKQSIYLFLILISFVGFHILFGNIINFKPIFSLTEIMLIYWIFIKLKAKIDLDKFLKYLIYSVLIASFLMILSFYNGINLNDFSGDSSELILNKSDYNPSIYRMSFFYTNFPLILSFALFSAIYFLRNFKSKYLRIINIITIIFLAISIVFSGNKTAMLAVILVLVFSFLFTNKIKLKNKLKILVITTIILYLLIYFIANIFLTESTYDLFMYRIASTDSLEDRFGVYVNAISLLFENPFQIFFGFGPDFFTCCGDSSTQNLFKVNYYTGRANNAIDSGILTFFMEFGILLFTFFVIKLVKLFKFSFKTLGEDNLLFFQIILMLLFYSITQLIGLSKILWIILIFILIIDFKYSKWKKIK